MVWWGILRIFFYLCREIEAIVAIEAIVVIEAIVAIETLET